MIRKGYNLYENKKKHAKRQTQNHDKNPRHDLRELKEKL